MESRLRTLSLDGGASGYDVWLGFSFHQSVWNVIMSPENPMIQILNPRIDWVFNWVYFWIEVEEIIIDLFWGVKMQ